MLDFEGKVVIVTGAGRGMGAAHARELAARGARIVANDLGGGLFGDGFDTGPAEEIVAEIEAGGGTAIANTSDVSTSEGCARVVADAVDAFGTVDGLLHNAGIAGYVPITEIDEEAIETMLGVHLFGALHLTREAWPHLADGGGSILYISSGAGLYGSPTLAHYAAAKLGVIGLTRVAAAEGRSQGIRVNSLAVAAASRMMDHIMAETPNMQKWFHEYMLPKLPAAAATWLLHPDCDATGRIFQAFGPQFSEVFIAETAGVAKLDMSAEDIRDRFAEIVDRGDLRLYGDQDEFIKSAFASIIAAGAAPPEPDSGAPVQFTAE
jgi:NAD(P)-dependent dehydrogenase (short-subunit alcohol dehydrogenase family)